MTKLEICAIEDANPGQVNLYPEGSFKITPLTEDDTLMSKEEFFRKPDRAREDIDIIAGRGTLLETREDIDRFLDAL